MDPTIVVVSLAIRCPIVGRLGTSRGAIFGGTLCVPQPPRPSIRVHLASVERGGRDAESSERPKHTDQAYPPARINRMTLGV